MDNPANRKREIIMGAIENVGNAFRFAPELFSEVIQIRMKAVSNNGGALEYASKIINQVVFPLEAKRLKLNETSLIIKWQKERNTIIIRYLIKLITSLNQAG